MHWLWPLTLEWRSRGLARHFQDEVIEFETIDRLFLDQEFREPLHKGLVGRQRIHRSLEGFVAELRNLGDL